MPVGKKPCLSAVVAHEQRARGINSSNHRFIVTIMDESRIKSTTFLPVMYGVGNDKTTCDEVHNHN
jgi:hypothetical protein